jgi:hypothetical protein
MSLTYPTKWSYGIYQGCSITEENGIYILRISHKCKSIERVYKIAEYGSKQECFSVVEHDQRKILRQNNWIKNEIRFLSPNVIEVTLTRGKTFITDAKFINIINNYLLYARLLTDNDGIQRHYIYFYKKNNSTLSFAKILTNFQRVRFLNGDHLDLRLENLHAYTKRKNYNLQEIAKSSKKYKTDSTFNSNFNESICKPQENNELNIHYNMTVTDDDFLSTFDF